MPNFSYKAVASNGKHTEGEIEAPNFDTAIDRLQASGLLPISAKEVAYRSKPKQESIFQTSFKKGRVKHKDVINITRELATLMNAGLPLDKALQTLISLSKQPNVKKMLQDIQNRVQGGAMLSDALEEQDRVFSPLYINMIKAAEAGGALDSVLARLAIFMERSQELRSSTISTLIYPAILLVVATLSVFLLLLFVVPQFVPLFDDAGKALPLSTQLVFSTANIVQNYWWIPLSMFIVGALYFEQQLKQPAKKLVWDRWILTVPLFGDLFSKLDIARFSRTLGTLLQNGVPLLESIKIVQNVISNKALSQSVESAHDGLKQGDRLTSTLEQGGLFPELALQLIQVGEDTGQLEAMLLKIADIYEDETKRSIQRMLSILEPIIILGLGIVIAFIIISILMAMLGLNDLIG